MTFTIKLIIFIIVWFIAAGSIIHRRWKEKEANSGLTVLFVANLFLMHCFPAILYLLPWHRFIEWKYMFNGFQEATYAVCAFGLGNLILSPPVLQLLSMPREPRAHNIVNKTEPRSPAKIIKMYFVIGLICYFILPPILSGLPTVTALMGAGQQLMITGLCLLCWQAWQENNKNRLRRWLTISLSLPFLSIMLHGYLGAGVMMTLIILIFMARVFRPKWKLVVIGVVLSYLGLSFYLMYMRDRGMIRSVVWSNAPIVTRIKVLQDTLNKPMLFNPFNFDHLECIDGRMNQNILPGIAVEYINSGKVDYAHGETLRESLLALIPRVVWQEKNIYAGSPGIVTKYTGIPFSEDTSVGVGQVMEFYINFGRIGVIIGFIVLGILVAIMDRMAGYYLAKGDVQKFTLWFLPGLASFMCGSFVEATASAGAAIFIANLTGTAYLNLLFFIFILYVLMELIKIFVIR